MTPPATRLPNFFIAGAPNAGTTSLYFYLQQHPQVYMSPVKEPRYFGAGEFFAERGGRDPDRYVARRHSFLQKLLQGTPRPLTWDAYLELFRDAQNEIAVGEASVGYLVLPAAAGAMRSRVPNARIIFLLRDPAEWLHTRYVATVSRFPRASFSQRFRAALNPQDGWAPALAVVRYATNLQRFYDVFPREQLQIHLYEDFRSDAGAVVRDMLGFLGVDPEYPIDVSHRHNPTVVPRFAALETLRRWALRYLPVTWLPPGVRGTLKRLYYRRRPPLVMDPADRALVIDHYRDEILRTSELIHRDLSAWLR